MLDELHPVARSLATSWLAHTNPGKVNMPTDIDPATARAFYLGIEATIARDTDKAEGHFDVLVDAGIWEDVEQVVHYIQSLSLSAHALHSYGKLARDTLHIRRIGDDLDDLAARIAAM